ncbi:hypothetical protein GCM10020227_60660 [Streptomyces flavovirens]
MSRPSDDRPAALRRRLSSPAPAAWPRCRFHHWFGAARPPRYVDANSRTSRLRFPRVVVSVDDSASRPGSCHKPPSALYVGYGKERERLAFLCRTPELTIARTEQVRAFACRGSEGRAGHPMSITDGFRPDVSLASAVRDR